MLLLREIHDLIKTRVFLNKERLRPQLKLHLELHMEYCIIFQYTFLILEYIVQITTGTNDITIDLNSELMKAPSEKIPA